MSFGNFLNRLLVKDSTVRSPNYDKDTLPPFTINPHIVGVNVDEDGAPIASTESAQPKPKQKISGIRNALPSVEDVYYREAIEPAAVIALPSSDDMADMLTSLVTGVEITISLADWSSLGIWHTVATSLMKKGYGIGIKMDVSTNSVVVQAEKLA